MDPPAHRAESGDKPAERRLCRTPFRDDGEGEYTQFIWVLDERKTVAISGRRPGSLVQVGVADLELT
jgi:hypothetical protein